MSRLTLMLTGIAVVLFAVSALAGTAPLSLADCLSALAGQGGDAARVIVWEIRLPRAAAAFGVGVALGLAGAALQGLLQNPLAEPGVLGVSAFAALGAVIAIFFGLAGVSGLVVPLAAILGAGLATLVLVAATLRGASSVTLLLIGIGLSSFAGALVSLAMNLAPNPYSLADLVNWMMGSVANRSWADIVLAAPAWGIGTALVLLAGPGLRALSLGEDTAISLGADIRRTRLLVIGGTSLLAGASVATAGAIGFVGIVAPHLVRPFVRHDPQRLLVPSALLAGVILLAADILIRVLPFQQELKLGVAAALVGGPVFIWIAARLGRASA
ncbi:MAG: iron ABC transporter permease [Hyphomonas sp.]|uniref:FecCD family ABC transporter permease n=1 Tax=Hyphomonas sp. TaxID=87 RepID=UPI0018189CFD|nr:iron ABC transporter permease [Hyphomonas sp.]MBU3920450.1 iron ABC transporter permease [Alphaproteobacteria bacterium]MBA3069971.1 iron ABC transporter permease [Hyphomonas sp.]MBU4060453.1 iron ABC transporter permease [Alphaproteobacteria bacterium]MBU4163121.1 iron ABC transporter permease [Alphaproteobacteria bacterium]MBU4569638.1 iron ABC transporter permease [Alphaproteobacteria bacterium]